NDVVRAVVPLPSGMTLIAGHFYAIGLSNAWRVARLDRTLAFDPTFKINPGAMQPGNGQCLKRGPGLLRKPLPYLLLDVGEENSG
ncbi:MAG TPA: delta-60 repeat domain-containing protein, partial [Nitrospira sp.]|nr:delta-60 repeat domain-containing protein [Nitrospira sp.]